MTESTCKRCRQPVTPGTSHNCADKVAFRILHKELVLLVALSVFTIPLFIFTRSMAARNRELNLSIAATWFQAGQEQLLRGNTNEAVDSFRKAATNDRDNLEYSLALAAALATAGHTDEAQQVLLRLRLAAPENGEINLNLARLAARQGIVTDAVRYYRNALYGIWPSSTLAEKRVSVRLELARFLLVAESPSQALSELLILTTDIPNTEQAHQEVGALFLDAAEPTHALKEFQRALQLNERSSAALLGAAQASFKLADYTAARGYLQDAVANSEQTDGASDLLEMTNLILSNDPLASRLSTSERIRRLLRNLQFAVDDLQACVDTMPAEPSSLALLLPLQEEATQAMESELKPANLKKDGEGFRRGLNLIYRIESATNEICPSPSSLQQALLLIGRKRGAAE